MSAIYILWLRELKRYVRSRAQIVASLGQPLLYLLALGFGLRHRFDVALGGFFRRPEISGGPAADSFGDPELNGAGRKRDPRPLRDGRITWRVGD